MLQSHETRWTCPSCEQLVLTPYCPRCGEQPLMPRDLTFRGLLEKAWNAFTNFDARTMRSIGTLLRQPGALSLAWTQGVHKPYVAPFQLFLIANVIFFAIQGLTGETVFNSSLESHLHHQDWSGLAQSLVAERLEEMHIQPEDYAAKFDVAVGLNAKSLIVLMTIPFTLILALVFARRRRPFIAHLVFSLHLYAFLLLLFCVALVAAKASAWSGFGGLEVPLIDKLLTFVNLAACMTYLFVAIGRVYGSTGAIRVVLAIGLAVAVGTIVLGYRFVLFLITLYTT